MQKPSRTNVLIIVILSVLILLAILGIIFRKKLRDFFSKLKFRKGKPPARPMRPTLGPYPRFPPSSRVYPGAIQRRVIPQRMPARAAPVKKPVAKKKGEIEDVLKKLKEIGK